MCEIGRKPGQNCWQIRPGLAALRFGPPAHRALGPDLTETLGLESIANMKDGSRHARTHNASITRCQHRVFASFYESIAYMYMLVETSQSSYERSCAVGHGLDTCRRWEDEKRRGAGDSTPGWRTCPHFLETRFQNSGTIKTS